MDPRTRGIQLTCSSADSLTRSTSARATAKRLIRPLLNVARMSRVFIRPSNRLTETMPKPRAAGI